MIATSYPLAVAVPGRTFVPANRMRSGVVEVRRGRGLQHAAVELSGPRLAERRPALAFALTGTLTTRRYFGVYVGKLDGVPVYAVRPDAATVDVEIITELCDTKYGVPVVGITDQYQTVTLRGAEVGDVVCSEPGDDCCSFTVSDACSCCDPDTMPYKWKLTIGSGFTPHPSTDCLGCNDINDSTFILTRIFPCVYASRWWDPRCGGDPGEPTALRWILIDRSPESLIEWGFGYSSADDAHLTTGAVIYAWNFGCDTFNCHGDNTMTIDGAAGFFLCDGSATATLSPV